MIRLKIIAVCVTLLALAACAVRTSDPSLVSAPPQIQVLQADRALADAINIAAHTTAVLWDTKRIDASTAATLKAWLATAAKLADDIATVASGTDSWPTIRLKIIALIPTAIAVQVGDDNLKAALINVNTLLGQIRKLVTP